MAKLKKEPSTSNLEKAKNQVLAGKITKSKNKEQIPVEDQVKLNTPARGTGQQKIQQQCSTSTTPFPQNSILRFTSTPMNVENRRNNGILSLKNKLPQRCPLSPIMANASNIRRVDTDLIENRKDKEQSDDYPKENVPKNDIPKAIDEKAKAKFPTGVRKTAPATGSASSNVSKENKRVPRSRMHAGIGKPALAETLLNTGKSKQKNISSKKDSSQTQARKEKEKLVKSTKTYMFSDSSDCSDSSDSCPPALSPKNDNLLKRLQSDWTSRTFEETLTPNKVQKPSTVPKSTELQGAKQYRENKCSKLRVRMCRSPTEPSFSVVENLKRPKPTSLENSVVKRLKSDWSTTSFEETPPQNRTSKDDQIGRKQVTKRRLTPLVEISCAEEVTNPNDTLKDTPTVAAERESLNNEKDYSSSAEFQSDDEENVSRLKKAPTWKDLLNKTSEGLKTGNSAASQAKVRCSVRRSRRQASDSDSSNKTDHEKLKAKAKPSEVRGSKRLASKRSSSSDTDDEESREKFKKGNVRKSRRLVSSGSSDYSSNPETGDENPRKGDKNSNVRRSRRLTSRGSSGPSSSPETGDEVSGKKDQTSNVRKSRRLASRGSSGVSSPESRNEEPSKKDKPSKINKSKGSPVSSSSPETRDKNPRKKDQNITVRRSRRLSSRRSSPSDTSSNSKTRDEAPRKKDKPRKISKTKRLASKASSDLSSSPETRDKKQSKKDKSSKINKSKGSPVSSNPETRDKASKISKSKRLASRSSSGPFSSPETGNENPRKKDQNIAVRRSRRLSSRRSSPSDTSSNSKTRDESPSKKDKASKINKSKGSPVSSSSPEIRDEKQSKKDQNITVRKSRRSSPSDTSSNSKTGVKKSKKKETKNKECGKMTANDITNEEDVPNAKRTKVDLVTAVPMSAEPDKSHDIGREVETIAQNVKDCEAVLESSPAKGKQPEHPNSIQNTITSPDHGENKTVDQTTSKYPHKFFHSRIENTSTLTKPAVETLKRRRSSKKKRQEAIYDFLSQSSSDTNNNNPVDDVIQKMIQTGKAVVAKHKKGSGKSVVTRGKGRRKKVPQKEITKIVEKTVKPIAPLVNKRQPLQEKPIEFDDDFHFDDGGGFPEEEEEENHVRDQRGFSNLARSAMIKQAGRIQKTPRRKAITDKKVLLEMARKFVSQSTPLQMTPKPMTTPQFSPMSGNKSPWRVDDDRLPNPFYLGRNSDNLPSYSSDHIPMTPTKNKSKSLSSFSSNDSNGENVAPAGAKTITNEASLQSLANTRKALNYRSPLKTINIIDVVTLPPLALHSYGNKSNENNKSKDGSPHKIAKNLFDSARGLSSNKSSNDVSNKNTTNLNHSSVHKSYSNKSTYNTSNVNNSNNLESIQNVSSDKSGTYASDENATDLFGFEELIDNENDLAEETFDKTILPNKEYLKERLQRLKNLRPDKPVIISDKTIRMKPVFDDVIPKQRNLKQMLCSTMIGNQGHSDLAYNDMDKQSFNDTGDLSQLFKDPEPETTFDDSRPRRTYNRLFKKKRKLRHNFCMFMESDLSEEEEEQQEEAPVKKYKVKQKKRQKKEDPELNKFVNEFNEMCKEVSQYELMVE